MAEKESPHPAWTRARRRGQKLAKTILQSDGGSLERYEVANILGVSEDVVEQLRSNNELLAVEFGGKLLYPAWQFKICKECGHGVLAPYLKSVLEAFQKDLDSWMKLLFFVGICTGLGSRRPLDVFLAQNEIDKIILCAAACGEQGAC